MKHTSRLVLEEQAPRIIKTTSDVPHIETKANRGVLSHKSPFEKESGRGRAGPGEGHHRQSARTTVRMLRVILLVLRIELEKLVKVVVTIKRERTMGNPAKKPSSSIGIK